MQVWGSKRDYRELNPGEKKGKRTEDDGANPAKQSRGQSKVRQATRKENCKLF